jgi:hypothetical protein
VIFTLISASPFLSRASAQSLTGDAEVIRQLAAVSDITQPHAITHYLYVSTSGFAAQIAGELAQRGFRTEVERSGYGNDWLVLAHHEVVPTLKLITVVRRQMEALVATVSGEYDGWEAAVR